MGKMPTLRTRAGPTAVHNSTASIVPDYVLPRRHFPEERPDNQTGWFCSIRMCGSNSCKDRLPGDAPRFGFIEQARFSDSRSPFSGARSHMLLSKGAPGTCKNRGQRVPMILHILYRLTEAGVRFHLLFLGIAHQTTLSNRPSRDLLRF